MNAKELAAKLTGCRYGCEMERLTKEEYAQAQAADLVIVYGASDDLCEVNGAIEDEIGCYNGGECYFTEEGILANACDDDNCPYFEKEKGKAMKLEINKWPRSPVCTFTYSLPIPHETFKVIDEATTLLDVVYCVGVVFSLDDVAAYCRQKAEAKP